MISIMQLARSLWKAECGSALLEATLIVPVLLSLALGVYEFGYYFYQEQLVTAGVRDAARFLAATDDPTIAACQSDAQNIATTGSASGATNRVSGWNAGTVSIAIGNVDDSSGTYNNLTYNPPNIPIITVSTNFAYTSLGFFGFLGLTAPTISVFHQERWVGGAASSSC